VPPLILQPLVENAIRHGFAATPTTGTVSVQAHHRDGRLRIDVDDDGPGVSERMREGYGLRNTRSRLRALYGDEASLTVGRRPGAGTRSRLDLPFTTEAAS
jgi:LytS/YehU family sensor histidine kinase